jgi:putative SOS response-associated peptidase YedK
MPGGTSLILKRERLCARFAANDFGAEVHDRMPALLRPEQFDHWLSGDMGVDASGERHLAAVGGFEAREQLEGRQERCDAH